MVSVEWPDSDGFCCRLNDLIHMVSVAGWVTGFRITGFSCGLNDQIHGTWSLLQVEWPDSAHSESQVPWLHCPNHSTSSSFRHGLWQDHGECVCVCACKCLCVCCVPVNVCEHVCLMQVQPFMKPLIYLHAVELFPSKGGCLGSFIHL